MTKKSKSPTKTPTDEPGELLARARTTMSKGLSSMDRGIERLIAKLKRAKDYSRDDASHLAWLLKQVSQIAGELRKMDVHDEHTAGSIPHDVVLGYLRALTKEGRAALREQLAAMDGPRRSVLG